MLLPNGVETTVEETVTKLSEFMSNDEIERVLRSKADAVQIKAEIAHLIDHSKITMEGELCFKKEQDPDMDLPAPD